MTTRERRTMETQFEVRAAPAGHKTIEGYAAKYDRYSENLGGFVEVVKPGAFDRAMDNPEILARYNHTTVLGRTGAKTLRIYSDSTGLGYEIDVNPKDPEAVSVLAKIERGDVHRSSFAFSLTRDGDEWGETEQGFPLRQLRSIARLHDVAPVDEPAYPDTDSASRTALRSFAEAVEVDPAIVEAAAEHGELIDLIRGARNLAPPAPPPTTPPPSASTAAASVVSLRLEIERINVARRRAHRRPR